MKKLAATLARGKYGKMIRRLVPTLAGGKSGGLDRTAEDADLCASIFDLAYYQMQGFDRNGGVRQAIHHYLAEGAGMGMNPSPLFDTVWYLSQNPDVAKAGMNPLLHYLRHGGKEQRSPHPWFDTEYYLSQLPERSTVEVISHYQSEGVRNGINPTPLFDTDWYFSQNPDVVAAGMNPLAHYIVYGRFEGRNPTPLFDTDWYRMVYPDVVAAGVDPFLHFMTSGALEGRSPNALFDTRWYRDNYPEIVDPSDPLGSFIRHGTQHSHDPSPYFSTSRYLAKHPDVAAAGLNALTHFLRFGRAEGRETFPSQRDVSMSQQYLAYDEISAATLTKLREDGIGWVQKMFLYQPLNVAIDPALTARPSVSILLPGVNRRYATGGPNTAYILGCLLAKAGVPINFVSMDAPPDPDLGPIKLHLKQLTGVDIDDFGVRILDASDRSKAFKIGAGDVFIATAWWTAQPAKAAAALTRNSRFYYLIQDYECLFYGASVLHAVAKETYEYDHLPIINTSFLRDQLVAEGAGHYALPDFSRRALVFEPAVDRSFFFPEDKKPGDGVKRLLFYTRPTMAERNLFALGVGALRAAVEGGLFDDADWEFIGMGESFDPIALGKGHILRPAPWLDFAGYAGLMRSADVLLSLMFSPHPSYPPLEMAACGKPVVTTTYGVKTADRLSALSPNIIAVEPRMDQLVFALTRALSRRDPPPVELPIDVKALPRDWVESLSAILPELIDELRNDGIAVDTKAIAPITNDGGRSVSLLSSGMVRHAVLERLARYRQAGTQNLVAIITEIDSKDPSALAALADSLLGQSTRSTFEWIIVCDAPSDTIAQKIRYLVENRHVRFVSDLAAATQSASARYVLALGKGVLPLVDAVRVIEAAIEQSELPPALIIDPCFLAREAGLSTPERSIYGERLIAWNRDILPQVGQKLSVSIDAASVGEWALGLAGHDPARIVEGLFEVIRASARQIDQMIDDVTHHDDRGVASIELQPILSRDEMAQIIKDLPVEIDFVSLGKTDSDGDFAPASALLRAWRDRGSVAIGQSAKGARGGWRLVDYVEADGAIVDRAFLAGVLDTMPAEFPPATLGLWLAMSARRDRLRLIGRSLNGPVGDRPDREAMERAVAYFGTSLPAGLGQSGPLMTYSAYHAARVDARTDSHEHVALEGPSIGLITTVYERTDPALFRLTADSVIDQIVLADEWVVLSHGPIPSQLREILQELDRAGRLRWLEEPFNLGIHGGLRFCLEHSTSDFIVSLDADDLLVRDAVAQLKRVAADHPDTDIFYSDEDLLIGNQPVHPYYRPDHDPVHLRAHSAIWHCILFRRALGLELGVYTNADAEYAQDWDTMLRFELAGHDAVHLPEVICHWRQHSHSLSNSGKVFQGSLDAIQACLELIRRNSDYPEVLAVEPYPIDIGSPDFHLRRLPRNAPDVDLISMQLSNYPAGHALAFPFANVRDVPVDRGIGGVSSLRAAISKSTAPYTLLVGDGVVLTEDIGLWQAIKHFELVDDVQIVSGIVSKVSGKVVQGSIVRLGDGLFDPFAGHSVNWRGAYWFSVMKPHCIDVPVADMMMVRTAFMQEALDAAPETLPLRSIHWWLSVHAQQAKGLIAMDPLFIGYAATDSGLIGDNVDGLLRTASSVIGDLSGTAPPIRGIAGFEQFATVHPR